MTFGGWRGAAWRRVALTAALFAAMPASRARRAPSARPVSARFARSSFKGNTLFRASDLALRIVTSPSEFLRRSFRIVGTKRCLDSDELRLDVGRLRVFYRRHGYFNTKVDTLVAPVKDGYGGVRVAFVIDEGPPVRVDSLRISGLDSAIAPIVDTSSLGLHAGIVFDVTRLQAAIDSMKVRLRNSGYPRGDVAASFSVDTARRRANVNLDVLPGSRAHIGEIRVTDDPLPGAPRRIGDATILRLLGVHDRRSLSRARADRRAAHAVSERSLSSRRSGARHGLHEGANRFARHARGAGRRELPAAGGHRGRLGGARLLQGARAAHRQEFPRRSAAARAVGAALEDRLWAADAIREWQPVRAGDSRRHLQREAQLLHGSDAAAAVAVRAADVALAVDLQRAARRVSGIPAHHAGGWRSVGDARGVARHSAAARLLARVRTHRRAAGAVVRRVQPMRRRVARADHRQESAARRRERASSSGFARTIRSIRAPARRCGSTCVARRRRSAPIPTSSSSRASPTHRCIAPWGRPSRSRRECDSARCSAARCRSAIRWASSRHRSGCTPAARRACAAFSRTSSAT